MRAIVAGLVGFAAGAKLMHLATRTEVLAAEASAYMLGSIRAAQITSDVWAKETGKRRRWAR